MSLRVALSPLVSVTVTIYICVLKSAVFIDALSALTFTFVNV
jgi:hypothetical protein